jgi:UDP:flavonoid glycosyltransferase YjiC (YdhE family)
LTVVFFISGHGFGHASREVEIIRALAAMRPDVRIVIRSSVSPALLDRTVGVPYELRAGPCDAGIVQSSSITHDDAATVREAVEFYSTFDRRIDDEVRALEHDQVALIVGDIPPLAFEVAHRLGVPGIAVSNFTWDWIFETHPGMADAAPWLVPRLRKAYRRATLALELPFPGGFEVFPAVRHIPLVTRRPTRLRADTRARFGIPADRPALLLSFGGYGLPNLDLAGVDVLNDWAIVTTDRSSRTGPAPAGVTFLPESEFVSTGFRYEDLVAAVDVVVTKPGYGILAECITTGAAMLYTSRGQFREYDVLVREMPRFIRCRFIEQPALLAGRWKTALETLMAQPAPQQVMRSDGAAVAATELTAALDASRSG